MPPGRAKSQTILLFEQLWYNWKSIWCLKKALKLILCILSCMNCMFNDVTTVVNWANWLTLSCRKVVNASLIRSKRIKTISFFINPFLPLAIMFNAHRSTPDLWENNCRRLNCPFAIFYTKVARSSRQIEISTRKWKSRQLRHLWSTQKLNIKITVSVTKSAVIRMRKSSQSPDTLQTTSLYGVQISSPRSNIMTIA